MLGESPMLVPASSKCPDFNQLQCHLVHQRPSIIIAPLPLLEISHVITLLERQSLIGEKALRLLSVVLYRILPLCAIRDHARPIAMQ